MQIIENKKELNLSDGINYLDKINKYNKTSSDNIEKRFNDFLPYFSMYCEFVADCKKIARNKHKEKKLSPKTLEKVMNEKQKNSYSIYKAIHSSEKTAIDNIAKNSSEFVNLVNERKLDEKKRNPINFRGIYNLKDKPKQEKTFDDIVKSFTERNIKSVIGEISFTSDAEKHKYFINEFMKSFSKQFDLTIIDNETKENEEIAQDLKMISSM
tara:strand:- start:230 stop:865 length:636 start_codon:yes stop_codon:yes gene_type:complete